MSRQPSALSSTPVVSERPSGRRRPSWLVGAMVLAVAMGGVGWVAGSRVRSADDAAADAGEPVASWVTVPVELRVLASTVVARGDVVPVVSSVVGVPGSASTAPVVTGVFVSSGDEVADGARVVEVSGRPVFVFSGDTLAYRDMRPGASGADVAALQAALVRSGCPADQDGGVVGEATKLCLTEMYEAVGYVPLASSATEAADLAEAEQSVVDAQGALDVAMTALNAASAAPRGSELLAAQAAADGARRALSVAEQNYRTVDAAGLVQARAELEDARDAVELADAELQELSQPAFAPELLAVAQAQQARDRAQAALDELRALSGPMVPYGEVVFMPSMPARVDSVAAVLGPWSQSSTGSNGGGGSASSGLLVVSSGGLQIDARLGAADAGLVRAGMTVELLDESSSERVPATVERVADQPTVGPPDGGLGFDVSIVAADGAEVPVGWNGRNVRVTFTAAESEGEVLVVPLAAVSTSASGATRVQVLSAAGEPVDVPVDVGLSADGFAEVTPAEDDGLVAGDEVIVGR